MPRRHCAKNAPARLEALAVAVLTPLGERDGAVRDAERRVGQALQTMTNDEGLSLMTGVESQQPGYLSHSEAAAALFGRLRRSNGRVG
jgi:hypothetical protein